jgi:hypothetical protein
MAQTICGLSEAAILEAEQNRPKLRVVLPLSPKGA